MHEITRHFWAAYGHTLVSMAEAWRKLSQKIKEKRAKKGGQSGRKIQGDQLTVQRLSSEVSGKAQKYARVAELDRGSSCRLIQTKSSQ